MKPIVLSDHAKDRMLERQINLSQIRAAIEEPHTRMPAFPRPRQRVMRDFGRNALDVIYYDNRTHYYVVSVVWLKEEDRFKE